MFISAKDDIEYLRSIYQEFADAVNAKVKDFFETKKYDTFDQDKNKEAVLRSEVARKNYDALKQCYAFITLIEDILQLNFIAELKKIAQKYGYTPENKEIEVYREYKAFLALELVANYPIMGKQTFTNQDFRNIFFTRPSKIWGDSAMVTQGQIVPILKITVDAENKLQKIEPQSFHAIEMFLPPILRQD